MPAFRQQIDSALKKLLEASIANRESIEGCTSSEILHLESSLRITLPAAYRYFLACAGHGAGEFLIGTDWEYARLASLQIGGRYLLDECGASFQLPSQAFVFSMHQGYSFLFFDTNADDPGVKLYVEWEAEPVQVAGEFTNWLLTTVNEEIAIRHECDSR